MEIIKKVPLGLLKHLYKECSSHRYAASLLKSEIDHCYKSGMDNYIPKPYKVEELIGAIYEEGKK